MASSPPHSRIAASADAEEVADLLDRFQAEFDEYTPGAKILAPRVPEHIARDLSIFLLAGPAHVGIAQLRFREYLLTGAPICYLEELYVVPDRRGEGHGRMLMESAVGLARTRGANHPRARHRGQRYRGTRAVREPRVHQPREGGETGDPDALLRA